MKLQIIFFFLVLVIAMASCQKEKGGEPTAAGPERITTEKGIAIGAPVTKLIGNSGGEISSADGLVKITVPAGAVATPTEFAIQPITNTLLKNETGRHAYRLLPEGSNFAKPINVSFAYTASSWNGSNEDLLTVLYQKTDGSWTRVPASLNKAQKRLEISTMHFSDWQVGTELYIVRDNAIVTAGQSVNLKIVGIFDKDKEVFLGSFTEEQWKGKIFSINNWRILRGPGTLNPALANENGAVIFHNKYTAPTSVTTVQKVEIAVTVKGNISIPDSSVPGGKRNFQEVTLLTDLSLVPKNYLTGTIGSFIINHTNVLYTTGQGFEISSQNGTENISMRIDALPGIGTFHSGDFISADGNSKTVVTIPGGTSGTTLYASQYTTCDPANPIRYSGVIKIDEFGQIGQPIKGVFEGSLYRLTGSSSGCPQYERIFVSFQFGTTRTM